MENKDRSNDPTERIPVSLTRTRGQVSDASRYSFSRLDQLSRTIRGDAKPCAIGLAMAIANQVAYALLLLLLIAELGAFFRFEPTTHRTNACGSERAERAELAS